jgi:GT2 family glycosyltransferase
MIYNCKPYANKSEKKNLGKVYNREMERLPNDDDYMIFVDHDAMPTTYDWQNQIESIIEKNPSIGAFTAKTNRVFCKWQLAPVDRSSNDIAYHRDQGQAILNKFGTKLRNVTTASPMSGVVIVLKKSTWKKIGGFKDGMLGVDNDFHNRLRKKQERLFLMEGIYFYHWYSNSNLEGKRNTDHLK